MIKYSAYVIQASLNSLSGYIKFVTGIFLSITIVDCVDLRLRESSITLPVEWILKGNIVVFAEISNGRIQHGRSATNEMQGQHLFGKSLMRVLPIAL